MLDELEMDFSLILILIIGFFVLMIFHVLLVRFYIHTSPWSIFLKLFIFVFLCILYFSYLYSKRSNFSNQDVLGLIIINGLSFCALSFCYFNFINLIYTSLRIRCLREIYMHNETMSEEEILKIYNAEIILNQRLKRLVESKNLIVNDRIYRLGENHSFAVIGKILDLFKSLLIKKK